MDISDISKVASRKRINTDAEKLREKVSRETAKIIKLKVAQDTAYWDLKEKLHQLETNHERLQQNMVEVQMQHEAVSGQYQEELRLRPDTLNKSSGTRDICDALEEYGERLRRSVARCRADQQALGAAYGACGARVRDLAADARRAAARRAELAAQRRDLAARLERCGADLRQREETAAALQADAARLALALDARAHELLRAGAAHRLELEAARERGEAERAARGAADERAAALQRDLAALAAERTEAVATVERMKTALISLEDSKTEMEKVIDERNQRAAALEAELAAARAEARAQAARLSGAERRGAEQAARLAELGAQRAADAQRLAELGAAAAERERELEAQAGTVARLMADLKGEAQARYRADAALDAARRAHDAALRAKDDELAAQMAIILDVRAEKERLQDRIGGMQATIDNVRKELTAPAPAPAPADRAERDGKPADDLLYGFLSDGSVDSDALDAREVGRRFAALAGGGGGGGARRGPASLAQIKKDLRMKNRTFFKNKRLDNDLKKLKE